MQTILILKEPVNGSLRCELRSETDPDIKYKIAVRISDGACGCTCEYFQKKCKWRTPTIYSGLGCKHIAQFRECLQIEIRVRLETTAREGNKNEP